MTPRLRELEAELESLNASNTKLLDEGKSPSQWELKTALLLGVKGVKIGYYKLALEDVAPVLAAALRASRTPMSMVDGITTRRELADALAEFKGE